MAYWAHHKIARTFLHSFLFNENKIWEGVDLNKYVIIANHFSYIGTSTGSFKHSFQVYWKNELIFQSLDIFLEPTSWLTGIVKKVENRHT